jgi:hypothetical protein
LFLPLDREREIERKMGDKMIYNAPSVYEYKASSFVVSNFDY